MQGGRSHCGRVSQAHGVQPLWCRGSHGEGLHRGDSYTNEDGEEKEIYIPKEDAPVEDLYNIGISAGINFEKYAKIPVKVTGSNPPREMESFESAKLRPQRLLREEAHLFREIAVPGSLL